MAQYPSAQGQYGGFLTQAQGSVRQFGVVSNPMSHILSPLPEVRGQNTGTTLPILRPYSNVNPQLQMSQQPQGLRHLQPATVQLPVLQQSFGRPQQITGQMLAPRSSLQNGQNTPIIHGNSGVGYLGIQGPQFFEDNTAKTKTKNPLSPQQQQQLQQLLQQQQQHEEQERELREKEQREREREKREQEQQEREREQQLREREQQLLREQQLREKEQYQQEREQQLREKEQQLREQQLRELQEREQKQREREQREREQREEQQRKREQREQEQREKREQREREKREQQQLQQPGNQISTIENVERGKRINQPAAVEKAYRKQCILACFAMWGLCFVFGIFAYRYAKLARKTAVSDPDRARSHGRTSLILSIVGITFKCIVILGIIVALVVYFLVFNKDTGSQPVAGIAWTSQPESLSNNSTFRALSVTTAAISSRSILG